MVAESGIGSGLVSVAAATFAVLSLVVASAVFVSLLQAAKIAAAQSAVVIFLINKSLYLNVQKGIVEFDVATMVEKHARTRLLNFQ